MHMNYGQTDKDSFIKKCTKLISVLLLCLVWYVMNQSLHQNNSFAMQLSRSLSFYAYYVVTSYVEDIK